MGYPERLANGRLQRAALLMLAALLLMGAHAQAAQAPVPELIFDRTQPQAPPIWVSAEAALGGGGQLRSDYLGQVQSQWNRMTARGEVAKHGCLEQGPVYIDPLPHQVPVHTLTRLREFSLAIVRGTISASQPGFYEGKSGELLRLDPAKVIAGDITAQDAPLFVYYPNATFSVGSHSFCSVDPRASYQPRPGDQVLVFVRTGVGGPEHRLTAPLPEDLFFETRDGDLVVPEALRDDPPITKAHSLDDIEAAIATVRGSS